MAGFSFNTNPASSSSPSPFSFASSSSTSPFSFSSNPSFSPSLFSASSAPSNPTFGTPSSSTASSTSSFGFNFAYSSSSTPSSAAPSFGFGASSASTGSTFGFGTTSTSSSTRSPFGGSTLFGSSSSSGGTTATTTTTSLFGSTSSTSTTFGASSIFGGFAASASAPSSTTAATASPVSSPFGSGLFGKSSGSSLTSFGASPSVATSASSTTSPATSFPSLFGSSSSSSSSASSSSISSSVTPQSSSSSTPGFSFLSSSSSSSLTSAAPASSASGFSFPSAAATSAPSFSFSTSASGLGSSVKAASTAVTASATTGASSSASTTTPAFSAFGVASSSSTGSTATGSLSSFASPATAAASTGTSSSFLGFQTSSKSVGTPTPASQPQSTAALSLFGTEMSLRDALKVPSFNVLDFDFDEQVEGEVPFLKQVSGSAYETRPLTEQSASEPLPTDAVSIVHKSEIEVAGSSGSQAKRGSILDDVDSDPEVRSLDEALASRPSGASLKSKGVSLNIEPKGLVHRKREVVTFSDVFADDMEIDPNTANDKFVPEWDIRNKDSVKNDLTARMFLFNISTPLDHARSRKMKNQDLGEAVLLNQAQSNVFVTELYRRWVEAESVKEDLEKETLALKRKIQRTPDAEKKLTQLSQDLQAQKEKVKSLTTQNQSSQAAAASASEERDKIGVELRSFAESSKKQDEEHKEVFVRMEKAISDTRAAYERMLAERDAHKTGEADVKARMAEMKEHHKAEIEELKLEILTLLSERDAHKTGEADVKARMAEMKEHHKAEIEELKLERDKIGEELRSFAESSKKQDEEHKEVARMEKAISNTRAAYERMLAGEADVKARMAEMKVHHKAEIEELKLERDKIGVELRSFAESSKKQDEEHKEVLARMEKAISDTRAAYERMLAERDAHKTGEADVKARMAEMKEHHKAEIEELKLEKADLSKKVEDLQATKTWLLTEGAQLLAKNVHKGPEMTMAVAAVNNAMSAIGVNSGLHNGYVYALKNKTPYAEVPLLNRNAEAELNTAIACFDSLTFPVVNDLPKLVNEPLSRIKDALFFAGGESSKE